MMVRRIFCTLLLAGSLLFAGPHPLVKGVDSIGLTVSGEVVFPLECKEFIERQQKLMEDGD